MSWAPMGAHPSWPSDIRCSSSLRHKTSSFISVFLEQLTRCLLGARHAHREGAELQDQQEEPAKSHISQIPTNYFQSQSLSTSLAWCCWWLRSSYLPVCGVIHTGHTLLLTSQLFLGFSSTNLWLLHQHCWTSFEIPLPQSNAHLLIPFLNYL